MRSFSQFLGAQDDLGTLSNALIVLVEEQPNYALLCVSLCLPYTGIAPKPLICWENGLLVNSRSARQQGAIYFHSLVAH